MTNRDAVVSALRILAAKENDIRFDGIARLKVDSEKREHFLFQGRPQSAWHGGIPNDVCVFIDWFDDDHCAAYLYLLEQDGRFNCTLQLSNWIPLLHQKNYLVSQ